MRRAGIIAAAIVPVVVAAGLTVSAGAAGAAASGRHTLPGTTPRWANAHHRSGTASGRAAVNGRVWLQYNNASQALALAKAVSDPQNASYRQFVTAAEFNARFRPTGAQVASVTSWLSSVGLKAASVPRSHRWVDFTGTVASTGSAFGTSYSTYRYKHHLYAAPSGDASVPASLATTVLTVTGLDTMPHVVTPARSAPFPPEPGFRNAPPCSTNYGDTVASDQPAFQGATLDYAVCGYKPPQLRSVYGQGAALSGSGVTVAITDAYASPNIAADASTYATRNDPGHPYTAGQLTQWTAGNFTRGQACGSNGWYGEETLDVEAVHAIAPAANIRYYGAASCFDDDLDAAVQQAMDDQVDIITNSWGEPELSVSPAAAHAESNMFAQAAATGISVLFSSGDDGDEAVNLGGTKSADLPAASPWATAVGGTSLGIAAGGSIAVETGWGTSRWSKSATDTWVNDVPFLYGAGGGISNYFDFSQSDSPADYQGADTSGVRRYVPDIGLDADPTTGMLVGETQRFGSNAKSDAYGEYRIGGTSLASPLFAGVLALAVQANGGDGLGLVNPAIYASQANPAAIRDVTGVNQPAGNVRADFANGLDASAGILYSVRTFDQDSSLATEAGYDQVTGVGAPASGFAAAIAGP
jgi:subtilase family serine protease